MNFALQNKITATEILLNTKDKVRVEVSDWESKIMVLKNKGSKLRDQNIYVDNDSTELERKIDFKIREYAKSERIKGNTAAAGYKRISINGTWFWWNVAENSPGAPISKRRPPRSDSSPKNAK